MNAEDLIYKLYSFFNVNNNLDLASKMRTTPQTISNWKSRNSVNAINKKCRELGIYNEIFGDLNSNINNFQNSKNALAQAFGGQNTNNYNKNIQSDNVEIDKNILKLVDTLYNFAKDNNKIDELKTDLSSLLSKYM